MTSERFVVPQISFESHVTDHSNVKEYPYFVRMSASEDLVSTAILKLIEKYRYGFSIVFTISWQRFNLIAPDNSDGSNSIEELKKAVERMPAEFREYVTVGESIRYPANMFLPLTGPDYEAVMANLHAIENTGNRINIL